MKSWSAFHKVISGNLVILLGYAFILHIAHADSKQHLYQLSYLFSMSALIFLQVIICVLASATYYFSASKPRKDFGKAYLLSGLLILLLGFGVCLGSNSII